MLTLAVCIIDGDEQLVVGPVAPDEAVLWLCPPTLSGRADGDVLAEVMYSPPCATMKKRKIDRPDVKSTWLAGDGRRERLGL